LPLATIFRAFGAGLAISIPPSALGLAIFVKPWTMEEPVRIDNKQPLISVIIPAYNAASVIARTLDSVLSQTFTDFEILVVNDGSPDTPELEAVLESYRIVYHKQENRGAGAARNVGVNDALGQFLAFLDADDYWLPNYLEAQMAVLQKSGADAVYCDALFVGSPALKGKTYMQLAPSRTEVTPESLLAVDVGIITSGVIARKQAVRAVGGFDETIRRGQDFDLWLRMAQKGFRFACHREVLLHYTVSDSGLSGDTVNQLRRRIDLLETIRTRGGLSASEQWALNQNMQECKVRLAVESGKARLLS
jgi:glycosyltransferase involved in cell wall biosynthesis